MVFRSVLYKRRQAARRGRYYSHKLNEDDCLRSEFSWE